MNFDFKLWLLLFLWVAASHGRTAAQSAPPTRNIATVPTSIHQLFVDDQAERTGQDTRPTYGPDVHARDAMRRAEAKNLLATGELKTAQDFHDAAFIFQHGDEANDYLLAHIVAIEAIVKGDSSSKWIAAATLDRYLQAIGQRQVFGTQYLSKSFLYVVQHKNDPDALNKPEAQQKGATQDPYDRDLVPDALRGDFCVPNQAAQATNLSELNAAQPMTGVLPAGCNR
jgi:hypothetical protein